jgi:hypothetical protein
VKLWSLFAAAALGLLAGGCVATDTTPHNLNAETVRSLRLDHVDVVVDPLAQIHWPSLADERAPGTPAPQDGVPAVSASPAEVRARAIPRVQSKFHAFVTPTLKSKLAGTRAAKARIVVWRVKIVGAMDIVAGIPAAVLLGPGAATPRSEMDVSIDFIDAKSGAVILQFPRTTLSTEGGNGLNLGGSGLRSHDPIERLLAKLDAQLSPWLLKS